ncbi:MAG: lipopolysaccharide biosynthesis protein [Ruminococcus sp.]|nr:lipopolysaccharide biosynthesis protein [Ruminococcus sp.]
MSDNSSVKTGVSGMLWMSMSSVATTIINLILTMVLARLLTAEDYGIYQAIAVLVGFADMLWQLGIGPALVRKKDLQEKDIITGHTINILMGLVIVAVINLFVGFWCNAFGIENAAMLRAYSLVFIANTVMAVPKAMLQRKCRFNMLAICNVGGLIVHAGLAIVLALGGMGAWALVLSILAQYVFQMIFVLSVERIKAKFYIAKDSVKELMVFGGGFTLTRIFNYIAMQGDNYVVNKTMGSEQLGYYGKAYNLLNYPANLVGQTIDQVLYPMMSKEQDNYQKMRRVYCAGTALIGLTVAPITAVAVTCRTELVLFVLGKNWLSVTGPLTVMICGLFFRTAYKLGNSLIRSQGLVYRSAAIQLAYAICVLTGAYIGHFYGLSAVAMGVTIAFTIMYFLTTIVSARSIHIKAIDIIKSLTTVLCYTLAAVMIGFFVYEAVMLTGLSNSFFILVICTILDFGLYILFYIISHKLLVTKEAHSLLLQIIDVIWNKMKSKKGQHNV